MYILLLLEALVQESILQFMFSSLFAEATQRGKQLYIIYPCSLRIMNLHSSEAAQKKKLIIHGPKILWKWRLETWIASILY